MTIEGIKEVRIKYGENKKDLIIKFDNAIAAITQEEPEFVKVKTDGILLAISKITKDAFISFNMVNQNIEALIIPYSFKEMMIYKIKNIFRIKGF